MSASTQQKLERLWRLAPVAALFLAGSGASGAQELCVTCEEPFAVYRCQIDEHAPFLATSPGAPLLCAKQLAQRGGHARCSIRRDSSGPCEGELVVVAPTADEPSAGMPPGLAEGHVRGGLNEGQPVDPEEPVAPVAVPETAAPGGPDEPQPEGPPKTVEELAKRTARSSKEGLKTASDAVVGAAKKTGEKLEEAGTAIGKAAKSTWRCLSSLFSDC